MTANIENLVLEHLKKIQAEQSVARERDQEMLSRLGNIESGLARIAREESSNYAEIIEARHEVDKIKYRLERIEQRLQLRD